MARLDSSKIPTLDENIISKLHSRNIFSVYDFMSHPCEDLMRITGTTFKKIEETRELFLKSFGGETLNTLDIYDQELSDVISTGLENLDSLLRGGLRCRNIYEICGSPCSGKSQLCHWMSAHVTQNSSAEVHYIDTSRNFCASRIQMILESKQSSDETIAKVMSSIRVHRIIGIHDLFGVLHNLASKTRESKGRPRLVIVDSLPILFGTISHRDLNRHLGNVASVCRFIVDTGRAVVVMVNSLRSERDRTIFAASTSTTAAADGESSRSAAAVDARPSLGTYWQLVPNSRLLISRGEGCRREILLWKSSQLAESGKKCHVEIADGGFSQALD